MYDTILHPTDGSEGSEAALEHVQELATTYGATVHVLHVVDSAIHAGLGIAGDLQSEDSPGMVGHPEGGTTGMVGERTQAGQVQEQLEQRGRTIVDGVAERLDAETVTAVEGGEPHQVIVDYTERVDIDLVVMGTHGRSGLDRYLLGSIAEKIVRLSDAPVVTVRSGE